MNISKNRETADGIIASADTTLGELLAMLAPGEKPQKTPTPKSLRETAGEPVAAEERCRVYVNGFAVYDNGSGRTVLWLPDCTSFTYRFDPMKESEKGDEISETFDLPEGYLETLPWAVAVTLIGDHRIETLSMKRHADRRKNKSLIRGDNEEGEMLDEMEEREDPLAKAYSWRGERFGENPEDAYIRKETIREMLGKMSREQREAFVLYYRDGYTEKKIGAMLGISQRAVSYRIEGARKRIEENF